MTTTEAQAVVQQIREQYPNPINSRDKRASSDYCVGAAVCRFTVPRYVPSIYFPDADEIAEALESLNPDLSKESFDQAMQFAGDIIEQNDRDEFDNAWDIVEGALAWHS